MDTIFANPFSLPFFNLWQNLSQHQNWPDLNNYNQLFRTMNPTIKDTISFVIQLPQVGRRKRGRVKEYISQIITHGEVATREHSWHDLLNALVWCSFPRAKRKLHELFFLHGQIFEDGRLVRRSQTGDAITCFDEGGLIIMCDEDLLPAVLPILQSENLDAKAKLAHLEGLRFFLFGHGLLEVLLQKHQALQVIAQVISVPKKFLQMESVEKISFLDHHLLELFSRTTHPFLVKGWITFPIHALDPL